MEHYYAERVETLVEWGVSQRTLDQLINLGLQSFVWAGSKLDGSKPRRLHLISRLPHQVDADDQWLTALRASVDEAGSRGEHILAGVDLTGWSYTAWYAARFDLNIWIILPPAPLDNFQSTVDNSFRQLNLNPARTVFIQPVFSPPLKKSICLRFRDELDLALADRVCPIAIRPKGFWAGMYSSLGSLDERFNVSYPQRSQPTWRHLLREFTTRKEDLTFSALELEGKEYLFHWTRGVYGPWPGETLADYYRALTVSASGNPRSAVETLIFIAQSGILRGEGRMLRGGQPALSFTSLSPVKALARIRYRSALGHWNYEPYGLAVPLTTLKALGACPVIYGERKTYNHLTDEQKPYYQYAKDESPNKSQGRGERGKLSAMTVAESSWRAEYEWRLLGDLDLTGLKEQIFLITPSRYEARQVESNTGYRTLSLEDEL